MLRTASTSDHADAREREEHTNKSYTEGKSKPCTEGGKSDGNDDDEKGLRQCKG
jgi:hypothetical protein